MNQINSLKVNHLKSEKFSPKNLTKYLNNRQTSNIN